jgi:hypothetical protein
VKLPLPGRQPPPSVGLPDAREASRVRHDAHEPTARVTVAEFSGRRDAMRVAPQATPPTRRGAASGPRQPVIAEVNLRLVWPQWQGVGTVSVQQFASEFSLDVGRRGSAVGSCSKRSCRRTSARPWLYRSA